MRWCDAYLNTVAAQVRVRRCRDALTAELRDHLELQKADYLAAGLPEAEAEARTLADMGDPVLVGGQLDAAHRPETRWAGILAALTMLALGLLLTQTTVSLLGSFLQYPESLCFPLLSPGSAMQLFDAAVVGMLLSALRGENLPEREVPPRQRHALRE